MFQKGKVKMKQLLRYKAIISYLFFGVCTTLVNVAVYWIMAHPLRASTMPSTVMAWLLAVLFAYVTNRKWVFRSQAKGSREKIRELLSFFSCRLATGVVDWLCMYFFADVLAWNDVIVKFAANVVVIILNYFASRLLVFKKGRSTVV